MEEEFHFSLLDEPWIRCLSVRSVPLTLSVRDLFARAHELAGLAGDLPTQDPPVLRLLLAILRRAHSGPPDSIEWTRLWESSTLENAALSEYLNDWRPRFDLFSQDVPFLQVAELRSGKGTVNASALLAPHLAGTIPLFSNRQLADPPWFTAAEAARWLLHVLAWDTQGIRTGAVGDPDAKNGKSYGNPVGPLGTIGVVIPLGRTLRDTLLLNLVPADENTILRDDDVDADLPAWERPPLSPAWETRAPTGMSDLFTWPSRRVRLVPERVGGEVIVRSALVCGGDKLLPGSTFQREPHTRWRRLAPKKGALGNEYFPWRHKPDYQVWRGMSSLLSTSQPRLAAAQGEETVPAAALSWVRGLTDRRLLPLGYPLSVLADGVQYGTKSAVVDEAVDDVLPLPVALLAEVGEDRRRAALTAVEMAESAARAFGALAEELYLAGGGSDDRQARARRDSTAGVLLARLDMEYRAHLPLLGAENADVAQLVRRWADIVRGHAQALAADLLAATGPALIEGRLVKHGAREWHVSGPEAELRFLRSLRRALGEREAAA